MSDLPKRDLGAGPVKLLEVTSGAPDGIGSEDPMGWVAVGKAAGGDTRAFEGPVSALSRLFVGSLWATKKCAENRLRSVCWIVIDVTVIFFEGATTRVMFSLTVGTRGPALTVFSCMALLRAIVAGIRITEVLTNLERRNWTLQDRVTRTTNETTFVWGLVRTAERMGDEVLIPTDS